MQINDVILKQTDEYGFWDKIVRFIELKEDNPLPDHLRHLFVSALSMQTNTGEFYDEPFIGRPFLKLVEVYKNEPSKKGGTYKYPYQTLTLYKGNLKTLEWLQEDGKLCNTVKAIREAYRKESENGIKSFSTIIKICIC